MSLRLERFPHAEVSEDFACRRRQILADAPASKIRRLEYRNRQRRRMAAERKRGGASGGPAAHNDDVFRIFH